MARHAKSNVTDEGQAAPDSGADVNRGTDGNLSGLLVQNFGQEGCNLIIGALTCAANQAVTQNNWSQVRSYLGIAQRFSTVLDQGRGSSVGSQQTTGAGDIPPPRAMGASA